MAVGSAARDDSIVRVNRADAARRVVAALNACSGIPTVLLEAGLVQRLIANRVAELECSLRWRRTPVLDDRAHFMPNLQS